MKTQDRPQSWVERAKANKLPTRVTGGVAVEPAKPVKPKKINKVAA